MKKIIKIVSLVAAMALAGSAQATQFVKNGDFSQLSNGLGQIGYDTRVTDWETIGYNIVMQQADVGAYTEFGQLTLWDGADGGTSAWNGLAPLGDNFVALDGDYNTGPIAQLITGLTIGKTYDLSFVYAFSQQTYFTGDTIQSLSTDFGGTTIFNSADYNLPSKGFSGWSSYTGKVTANGTSEVLSFLAHGNQPVPPFALFTDVSLTGPVPEPATWAMMIVGLGCVGAVARRRRQALATA